MGPSRTDGGDVLRVGPRVAVPLREIEWSASGSSGPGGQNVNRVRTKVTLRWPFERSGALPADVAERLRARFPRRVTAAGELVITSQRYRKQHRNAEDCLEKLRETLLEVATPPRARRATRVPRRSIERRLSEKRHRSRIKRERGQREE